MGRKFLVLMVPLLCIVFFQNCGKLSDTGSVAHGATNGSVATGAAGADPALTPIAAASPSPVLIPSPSPVSTASPLPTATPGSSPAPTPMPSPVVLKTYSIVANADNYVRAGIYAADNYGTATILNVRNDTTADNNRDTYFKFSVLGLSNVTSAKLQFYAALGTNVTIPTSAYSVCDTSWIETSMTWNTRPPLGNELGSVALTGTAYQTYEIDVTVFVQSQVALGRALITLALHDDAVASTYTKVYSRENSANRPTLVIQGN